MMGFRVEKVFFDRHIDISRQNTLHIILGFHRSKGPTPKNTIVVQSEQPGSKWMTEEYIKRPRHVDMVWDFSDKNCKFLMCQGVNSYYVPTRVPMGVFVENFDVSKSNSKEFIEVLFYGTFHERKQRVELDLKLAGLNVVFRYSGLFEHERDQLISVSKVVLILLFLPLYRVGGGSVVNDFKKKVRAKKKNISGFETFSKNNF